jgi:hypothetical protein
MPSLRTALTLTLTAAAAALVPAGTAAAAALPAPLPGLGVADALPTDAVTGALHDGAAGAVGPLKHLTPDPLSNTGTDPLDNAIGSQIADFPPVSTALATGPVTHGGTLATLPVVGTAAALLPG